MAVQVVVAPGASVVTGQLTAPALGSATVTEVRVTLPVFVTTKLYRIVEPAIVPVAAPACLSRLRLGVAGMGVSVASEPETGSPTGGVPSAVAELTTCPASTSDWRSVYEAVHVVCSPGASVETGQETVPSSGSLTPTEVSVTLPVFVTTNEYGRVEPTTRPVGAAACLSSERLGRAAIVVSVVSVALTASPDGGFAETVARFST